MSLLSKMIKKAVTEFPKAVSKMEGTVKELDGHSRTARKVVVAIAEGLEAEAPGIIRRMSSRVESALAEAPAKKPGAKKAPASKAKPSATTKTARKSGK